MPMLPFMQVVAFTARPLAGNPCAIVFDADALDARTMLAIAREMNLSETAFVRRSEVADFGARYFTPAEEIPMAGHPTLATAFALVATGRLSRRGAHTSFTLELPVGPIRVDIRAEQGAVRHIVMTQRRVDFSRQLPEDIHQRLAAMLCVRTRFLGRQETVSLWPLHGDDPQSCSDVRIRARLQGVHEQS
jgi:trans-2,3-dihydro-3-hydroxyanthranilate isomerase